MSLVESEVQPQYPVLTFLSERRQFLERAPDGILDLGPDTLFPKPLAFFQHQEREGVHSIKWSLTVYFVLHTEILEHKTFFFFFHFFIQNGGVTLPGFWKSDLDQISILPLMLEDFAMSVDLCTSLSIM